MPLFFDRVSVRSTLSPERICFCVQESVRVGSTTGGSGCVTVTWAVSSALSREFVSSSMSPWGTQRIWAVPGLFAVKRSVRKVPAGMALVARQVTEA